tara:strand:+ start:214 stop:432 length:219 start_codon:yes stop_codon:yes gene_type:complete
MFNPFVNFESLDDEQLLEKKLELNKKCATINNGDIRGQVLGMIKQIDLILFDRQQRKTKETTEEFDDSISIG